MSDVEICRHGREATLCRLCERERIGRPTKEAVDSALFLVEEARDDVDSDEPQDILACEVLLLRATIERVRALLTPADGVRGAFDITGPACCIQTADVCDRQWREAIKKALGDTP